MAAAKERGIRFTNHTDFNVTPLDPMMTIWSAVTRQSRSGKVVGPEQRVDPMTALEALTIDAAYQNFEEDEKGSIEPGKLADLVILSANPLNRRAGCDPRYRSRRNDQKRRNRLQREVIDSSIHTY